MTTIILFLRRVFKFLRKTKDEFEYLISDDSLQNMSFVNYVYCVILKRKYYFYDDLIEETTEEYNDSIEAVNDLIPFQQTAEYKFYDLNKYLSKEEIKSITNAVKQ